MLRLFHEMCFVQLVNTRKTEMCIKKQKINLIIIKHMKIGKVDINSMDFLVLNSYFLSI